jgi:hypothetical protein
MSFTKISRKGAVALSALSLLFVVSCGKDDSKKTDRKDSSSQSECPDCEKRHTHDEAEAKANPDEIKAPATTEKNDIYAETVADYTYEETEVDGEKIWAFTVSFIAEEGSEESIAGDGKSMKNHPIESHFIMRLEDIEEKKGYKPGIKPLKHQKIKIKYEKDEPIMFYPLENLKYQDEQGQIIELD